MSTLEGKDVTKISGPAIVGCTLNWYLHGILSVQYILYLLYSRNDKLVMKIIVHLLFALDTVQTILSIDDTFFYFVYGFGDVERLFELHFAFDIPTLDALIGLLVQGVYCWRIWRLSGWKVIPMLSLLISLFAGASGFAAGVQFKIHPDNPNLGKLPAELWLIGSVVADVIIASSMTYILMRGKKGTAIARSSTGDRIFRLLVLILEANAITAAVALTSVIMFFIPSLSPPTSNFYQLGPFLLGKLYSNSFMVLLNQRHHGSESQNGSAGSYPHGSRPEAPGINIELKPKINVKNGNPDRTSYSNPRAVRPPPPKAQAQGWEDDY